MFGTQDLPNVKHVLKVRSIDLISINLKKMVKGWNICILVITDDECRETRQHSTCLRCPNKHINHSSHSLMFKKDKTNDGSSNNLVLKHG